MNKYKILGADGCSELEQKVAELIQAGWKPQGGIACMLTSSPIEYFYYQAMVKEYK